MLYAALLRSPHGHARIRRLDPSQASRLPGVAAVLTGEEVARLMKPFLPPSSSLLKYYPMAVHKVRFVGEPVAAVVATERYLAEDALELIHIDYELLPPIVEAEAAMAPDAPLLHEEFGSNVAWQDEFTYGPVAEAFSRADHVFKERFTFGRYSATALETYGCVARFEPGSGSLTIWDGNQQAGLQHARLANVLNLREHKLRLIEPNIGGGFGPKISMYPYSALVALLSMKVGRPVKWIADRREELLASSHSADRVTAIEFAVNRDGAIQAVRMRLVDNFGAYLRHPEPQNLTRPFQTLLGCYRIKAVAIEAYGVLTNRCPTGPSRGYGCQHAYFSLERMVDICARQLGLDPAEMRRRNFIQPEELPYTTPIGCIYDSGDYPETLRRALAKVDYEGVRRQQQQLRRQGHYLGIGIATTVEPGPQNVTMAALWGVKAALSGASEAAAVKFHPTGTVTVRLGSVPQGQGHETVAAQILADELGLHPDEVEVMTGFDSHTHPYTGTSGTYSSRFAVLGTGALLGAAALVREKLLRIAAHRLEVAVDDLRLAAGLVSVKGAPDRTISVRDLCKIAYHLYPLLPPGMEPGLEAGYTYNFPYANVMDEQRRANLSCSYANSAHIAVVEVDARIGTVKILRYVVVHDCGTMINPLIVKGQIEGAVAHGIGGALYEEYRYNQQGQLLTTTFMDYLAPTAVEVPEIEIEHLISPSPFTPLGAKGTGESGAMAPPAAIANAVEDALLPLGIQIREVPLSPYKVWTQIAAAMTRSPNAFTPAPKL
jgi:2-furoyl-CoA dehydrogenase large subunit